MPTLEGRDSGSEVTAMGRHLEGKMEGGVLGRKNSRKVKAGMVGAVKAPPVSLPGRVSLYIVSGTLQMSRILRWEDFPGFSSRPSVLTKVFQRGRQGAQRQ